MQPWPGLSKASHPADAPNDEVEVTLRSLDTPDQLMPTYENRIVRRKSWLPPFPLKRRYDRDRDVTSRFEE